MKNRAIAKQRLDKYYNLAKEKGYRARSAFKLIQLNKKYGFLKDAHILIDLCAAPGGWLQVATQEMPRPNKIIGIDLEPIKYIGDAETFVCDITSDECRKRLYGILEDRQADVILHDGAPNVGTSWESDAFNQNLLVFYSLQLASIFLREGGTFVTKIFRSNDYDSLISLLSKMFNKVEATKPLSSRSQSAEIFVVCVGYKGYNGFDEKILDYNNVFTKANEENNFDEYKYTKIKFTEYLRSEDENILNKITEIEYDLPDSIDVKEELKYLMKDIKIISEAEKKKIKQKKKQIIRQVQKGIINIPELDFLKVDEVTDVEEEFEMVTLSKNEKLSKLEGEINEINKEENKKQECSGKLNHEEINRIDKFYDDDLFKNLDLFVEEAEIKIKDEEPEVEKIEVESCSDSLDLDEEEILCIAKYKSNPEGFIEDTVDRYIKDPDEKLPNYLREDQKESSRPNKQEEARMTKKEKEAINRRKTRAERRAEKFMKNMIIEESDEERLVAKAMYKKEFKKTKHKSRIVLAKKKGTSIPRGKGRLVFFDRRLKKDKKNLKK